MEAIQEQHARPPPSKQVIKSGYRKQDQRYHTFTIEGDYLVAISLEEDIVGLWHGSCIKPLFASSSPTKSGNNGALSSLSLSTDFAFHSERLSVNNLNGMTEKFQTIALNIYNHAIVNRGTEDESEPETTITVTVVATTLSLMYKWNLVFSVAHHIPRSRGGGKIGKPSAKWEHCLMSQSHQVIELNSPLRLLSLSPHLGGECLIIVEKTNNRAVHICNDEIDKLRSFHIETTSLCSPSQSNYSTVSGLCFLTLSFTLPATSSSSKKLSNSSLCVEVLFVLCEDGLIQGWLVEEDYMCFQLPPPKQSLSTDYSIVGSASSATSCGEEALCIESVSLSWNRSNAAPSQKCTLFIGYRSSTLRKVELSLLSSSKEEGGIFLSYRDVAYFDLMKEVRQRTQKGLQGERAGNIRREVTAIPLDMKMVVCNDTIENIDNTVSLYIMTTDGLLVVDENCRCLTVLTLSQCGLGNSSVTVSVAKLFVTLESVQLLVLAALDKSLKAISLPLISRVVEFESLPAKAIGDALPFSRLKPPKAPRIYEQITSAPDVALKITSNEKNDNIDTIDIAEMIEFDFFQIHRGTSSPSMSPPSSSGSNTTAHKRTKGSFLLQAYGNSTDSENARSNSAAANGRVRRTAGVWEAPLKTTKGRPVDMPVTFHAKVKSSGYGQISNDPVTRRMEARRKEKERETKEKEKALRSSSAPRLRPGSGNGTSGLGGMSENKVTVGVGGRIRQYPMDDQLSFSTYQPTWDYPGEAVSGITSTAAGTVPGALASSLSPIFYLAYSADSTKMAIASQSSVLISLKLPRQSTPSKDQASAFMGHNGPIKHVAFSHRKTQGSSGGDYHILSSSSDGSARMWKSSRVDCPAVNFTHWHHQTTQIALSTRATRTASSGSDNILGRNRPYGTELSYSQFYYQDKFVLVNAKASLLMYNYDCESSEPKSTDLTRFLHCGKYHLVNEWNFSDRAQNVVATAAMNSVQSPIILTSTSDKIMHILDANEGRVLRTISLPHEKSLSYIALSVPSPHVPIPRDAHNVFLTTAPDNTILLWDLRQASAILRYSRHVNRREAVQVCFSPCMRYFATGSEDKTARIFDIVAGKELQKLNGHRDVVTAVAYNPLFAQLATGSYDGTVRFYCDPNQQLYC